MKESSVGMDRVGGSALVCVDWPSRVLGGACDKWSSQGAVVRWLRGDRMRTVDGLFDEFAASLQFPWYFGRNWGAFDECLADLGWIDFQSLVIVVFDARLVLVDELLDTPAFLRGVLGAYEVFAHPVELGEWWDRPAKPFHIVLQISKDDSSRWLSGIEVVRRDSRGMTLSTEGMSLTWLESE